jgi:hypothetical protein
MICVDPSPDVDLTDGGFQNLRLQVFAERPPQTLEIDLAVDSTAPGTFTEFGGSADIVIPMGTRVRSYLVHFDPPDEGENMATTGTAHFDEEILGLVFRAPTLDDTDDVLGLPLASYAGGSGNRSGDEVDDDTIVWDGSDITVTFDTGGFKDEVRVVVAADLALGGDGDERDAGEIGETAPYFRGAGGCACDTTAPSPRVPPLASLLIPWIVCRSGRIRRRSRARAPEMDPPRSPRDR